MYSETYDGAANVAANNRRVQARIRQIAPYMHRKTHSLSLALIHANKGPMVRNIMDIVQQVPFVYDYSAKRQKVFQSESYKEEVPHYVRPGEPIE